MSVRNLESLFNPTHVAVVGAGGKRTQLGHIVLRNIVDAGFEGVVYPINPSRESVGGIQAYAGIAERRPSAELAIVCTPAAVVPEVVRECGKAGVGGDRRPLRRVPRGWRRGSSSSNAASSRSWPATTVCGSWDRTASG